MADSSGAGSVRPDWYADPTGRHQYRYWDGSVWTDNVADGGEQGLDPVADAKARIQALQPLARTPISGARGRTATVALIGALEDPDFEVQKFAVRTLGDRNSAESVAPLLAVLDTSENMNIRAYAAEALVKVEPAESAFVAALRDDDGPPYRKLEALSDSIRFGKAKESPRCSRILRLAFRECWGSGSPSPKTAPILGLMMMIGDPITARLSEAMNSEGNTGVQRVLGSF